MTTSATIFRDRARELARVFAPRAARWDRNREYCWENVRDLTDAGLMGMSIPMAYGGQGASFLDVAIVVEEIAKSLYLVRPDRR